MMDKAVIKMQPRGLITIPAVIRRKLDIDSGQFLIVKIEDEKIVLEKLEL